MPKSDKNGKNESLTAKTKNNKKQMSVLKNKCKEEQSSMINPDGRKQYDRAFLLQLQNAPQSLIKPANLPDIPDIIIKKNEWVPRLGDNNAQTMDHTRQEEEHWAIMAQNLIKFKTEEENLLDSGRDDRKKTQTGDKSGQKPIKNNTSHMEEIFKEIKQFSLQSKKKYGKTEQLYSINPDGRKQYDREFLLQLQNAPQSLIKPANLPDIPDIIIKETAINYSQRMISPAFQNSMPTTQQGLFQIAQQSTSDFTHTLTHTYSSPPAVLYNQAAQQQKRSLMIAGMNGQGHQPTKKRECTLLPIMDPASGKDIGLEIQLAQSTLPLSDTLASHSTIVNGHEPEVTTPVSGKENQDINESYKTPDKSSTMDSTPITYIVDKRVVAKVDVRTEDVYSNDACIAVRHENSNKQKAVRKFKEGKNYSILNESVKGEEQPLSSLPHPSSSGDFAHGLIHPQHSSTSRKLPVESLERQMQNLEKEKLQLEIKLIKLKHKKLLEEMEVLKLQKDLLKMKLIS